MRKGDSASRYGFTVRSSWFNMSSINANQGLTAECPCGGENPQGFHPFLNPILVGRSAGADRARTIPDWGEDE
jgi:hypothetical protein